MAIPGRQTLDLTIGFAAFALAVVFSFGTILGPAPDRDVPVLVIAPPWGAGAASIVAAAGGRPIGPVSAPFAVLAAFDETLPRARLRASGAWALRDGRGLALLCGVAS